MKIDTYINSIEKFLNYEIDREVILNAFLAKLAYTFSHKRVKFRLPKEKPIIANYYGMTFARSGFSKDKILRDITNSFFEKTDKEINLYFKEKVAARKKEIEKTAIVLFPGNSFSVINSREKWLAIHEPREVQTVLGESTPEAFLADRRELTNYKNGCMFFVNGEFFDFLIKADRAGASLTTVLAEIYDHGDDKATSLKSEKKSKEPSIGIPNNILVYASTDKMYEDKSYKILLNILSKQYARRCFFVFNEKVKDIEIDYDSYRKKKLINKKKAIDCNNELLEVFNNIKQSTIYDLEENSEAEIIYDKYLHKTKLLARDVKEKILQVEMFGRSFKTIKLATFIQALENPTSKIIEPEAMEKAIEFSEIFAGHFKKLIVNKPKDTVENIYDFFVENEGRKISKTELRNKGFYNENYFAKQWKEIKPDLEYLFEKNGYEFIEDKSFKNQQLYELKEKAE